LGSQWLFAPFHRIVHFYLEFFFGIYDSLSLPQNYWYLYIVLMMLPRIKQGAVSQCILVRLPRNALSLWIIMFSLLQMLFSNTDCPSVVNFSSVITVVIYLSTVVRCGRQTLFFIFLNTIITIVAASLLFSTLSLFYFLPYLSSSSGLLIIF